MEKRVPASERTREALRDLIEFRQLPSGRPCSSARICAMLGLRPWSDRTDPEDERRE